MGGLYVDDSYIYYSCTEEYEDETKEYAVRKCKYDGTVVDSHICDCFVRGIGLDHDGNVYILCSQADPYVVQLNKNFRDIMNTTERKHAKHFSDPKGMIVTSEFVLVSSSDKICVFDLLLKFYHKFKPTSIEDPIAIATFQTHYIVTGKSAIEIIDIDLKNRKVNREIPFKSMHQDDEIIPFDPNIRLRGICAIGNYIYVTQVDKSGKDNVSGLPIMCLEFDGQRLKYVCDDTNISRHCTNKCTEECGSVVIFCHNKTLYYGQGSFDELFHIVKATHNPGEAIESNKMFDVC